jgi:hypothetical protein
MKRLTLTLLIIISLIPKQAEAQSNGAAIAAVAGGLLAIGTGISTIGDMKERAELSATQWIFANHSELTSFSLKTLDFDGKNLKDLSNTSIISFKIQEFSPTDNPVLDGKKQVLFAFTSYGWISEQGIDFNRVNWYLVDKEEWLNMMVSYAKVSSNEKNEAIIKDKIVKGLVVNKGVKIKGKMEIPFFKLEGDMYLATDYSSELKLIYNENSLGIFIKKTGNLVQMRRGNVIEIHEYFYDKN